MDDKEVTMVMADDVSNEKKKEERKIPRQILWKIFQIRELLSEIFQLLGEYDDQIIDTLEHFSGDKERDDTLAEMVRLHPMKRFVARTVEELTQETKRMFGLNLTFDIVSVEQHIERGF